MTILDALSDPQLLGAAFADAASWQAWRVFQAALFGLAMTEDDLGLYRACTGRPNAPTAAAREAWVIVGRRGGKSRVAALIAVYLAAFRDYGGILAPGERATIPIIACDRRQARTVFRYVAGLFEASPVLGRMVAEQTAESIELRNRVAIEIHTCSFRSVKGYTVPAAILDECAFYRTEDSATPDVELVRALRPAMATVKAPLLIGISSPYARRGVLWEMYRAHYGKNADPVLVWQAATHAMNPAVDESVIVAAYEADDTAASAEYGGEFRIDVEGLITEAVLDACIMPGRHELPPLLNTHYVAFVDPSGGSVDSFTLGIAHGEARGGQMVAVLDAVREVKPPFSPDAVVAEFAAVLKSYGLTSVTGDRYGGEWPRERFAVAGINYEVSERVKSDIYLNALPFLNAGRVELLGDSRLRRQLLELDRRTGRGGRDSVDHGPGGHDDLANVAAGALVLAAEPVGTGPPGLVGGQRTLSVPQRVAHEWGDVF
jgi:hypothetical protein